MKTISLITLLILLLIGGCHSEQVVIEPPKVEPHIKMKISQEKYEELRLYVMKRMHEEIALRDFEGAK